MLKCGDCKFWGNPDEVDNEFRSCTRIIHDDDFMTSDSHFVDWDEFDNEIIELTAVAIEFRNTHKVVVQDGSGYYAALRPREDFGCVLFEEKK